ncbi:MAG: hypothetical protein ABIY70_10535 [Capsulimonas sp.]|uniref:hypothetical protein n=1 Tax=Capsulimonas sp. TaxID=2494211 RepID=UPI003266F39F
MRKTKFPPQEPSQAKREVQLTWDGEVSRIIVWAAFLVPTIYMGCFVVRDIVWDWRDGRIDGIFQWVVLEVIAAAICGMCPALFYSVIRRFTALLRDGHEVYGIIHRLEPTRKGVVNVRYSFWADGKEWSGWGVISAADKPFVRQSIRVLYLPDRPWQNKPLASIFWVAWR